MKLLRIAAATTAVAAIALSGAAVSTAAAAPESRTVSTVPPTPRIVGGSDASINEAPFAALQLVDGEPNCSGSQIASTWVLTAKHCIEGKPASTMSVQLGAAEIGDGTEVKVKRAVGWSGGDVALLELATSYQNTYASLATSNPAIGADATIFGWGAVNTARDYPDALKTAAVSIVGTTSSSWPGPSIVEKGVDGQALWGDSGGPLIVDGKVVGVCSGPLRGAPGTITGTVMYASVIAAGSWIESISGVSGS